MCRAVGVSSPADLFADLPARVRLAPDSLADLAPAREAEILAAARGAAGCGASVGW